MTMQKFPRINEYKALAYRIFLAFLFYSIARLLFFCYNLQLIKIESLSDFFLLSFHGITFDTTAILYINSLFILLSILPLKINTQKGFQKFLFYLYFSSSCFWANSSFFNLADSISFFKAPIFLELDSISVFVLFSFVSDLATCFLAFSISF